MSGYIRACCLLVLATRTFEAPFDCHLIQADAAILTKMFVGQGLRVGAA